MNFLHRISPVMAGLTLTLVTWIAGNLVVSNYNDYLPPETVMSSKVSVPDFVVGENPIVIYQREVIREFLGDYSVEVKDVKSRITVCSGREENIHYTPDEVLNAADTDFNWYVGNDCAKVLTPGQYVLETTYTMNSPGLPTKYLTTISNIFEVETPA